MRVGFTFDLRDDYLALGYSAEEVAEFESEATVAAIAATLTSFGHSVDRIGGLERLMTRLVAGERWDLVFNIAEGLHGLGREAAVPTVLDACQIPYTFSDPLTLCVALHKPTAKRLVRDAGVPTPDFAVIETPQELARVSLPLPLFVKPVAEGSSKGVSAASKIDRRADLEQTCRQLLDQHRQPLLVERYLPGREFTVGIVGTGGDAIALGVMEIRLGARADQAAYTYSNKTLWEDRVTYSLLEGPLADEAKSVALTAWRCLGGRDCGRIDVRCDERGVVNFIEVNTLPGLNPRTADIMVLCGFLKIDYRSLLGMILDSAMRRVEVQPTARRAGAIGR